jgi:putative peptidoglycan lipid II flippase
VDALRDTIIAFAPGLVGYALVALLTRALYARGLWKAPTVCVVVGWLVGVAVDLVLSRLLPVADRGLALGAGHSAGVTVAGIGLLVVVSRAAGAGALSGVLRAGAPAVAGGALGAGAGLFVAGLLGAAPVPDAGVLPAVGVGLVAAAVVLVIAATVMMGTGRAALIGAVHALRRPDEQRAGATGGAR